MRTSAHRPGILLLDFLKVPSGLSAGEFENYLRERGEEIHHSRGVRSMTDSW
jgi:hypothetical protein